MRDARTLKLERLFARIVAASVPACAVACAAACSTTGSGNTGSDAGEDARVNAVSDAGEDARAIENDSSVENDGSVADAGADACSSFASCCPILITLDGGLPDASAFDDASTDPGTPFFPVDGGPNQAECVTLCHPVASVTGCFVASEGPPVVMSCQPECTGRRPAGLRAAPSPSGSPLGAYFASMTQLEAASVPAFRRMARELARFGAPRRLVRAAERAVHEETRHARSARALARRFGARPASFEVEAYRERSLEDFAIENAIEGCVRETYGALVATWQARAARDPRVRAHMAKIAGEETSHAALAWKTHAWARARLDRAGRARLDGARVEALRSLADGFVRTELDAEVATLAGVPEATIARELALALSSANAM